MSERKVLVTNQWGLKTLVERYPGREKKIAEIIGQIKRGPMRVDRKKGRSNQTSQ